LRRDSLKAIGRTFGEPSLLFIAWLAPVLPPHTYMVVAGHGFLIDLSRISGELWDQNNVASCAITWRSAGRKKVRRELAFAFTSGAYTNG
jgi:hypothetical protein